MMSFMNGMSLGCPGLANGFGDGSGDAKQRVPSTGISKPGGIASTGEDRILEIETNSVNWRNHQKRKYRLQFRKNRSKV